MPFQTGLCQCMDDKSGCCDVMCCTPCQIGRQCSALDGMVNEGNCIHCVIACCFGYNAWQLYACCLRMKISDKYQMNESAVANCCIAWCFPECSLCQTHRELTLQNAWPGGACYAKQPYNSVMN